MAKKPSISFRTDQNTLRHSAASMDAEGRSVFWSVRNEIDGFFAMEQSLSRDDAMTSSGVVRRGGRDGPEKDDAVKR